MKHPHYILFLVLALIGCRETHDPEIHTITPDQFHESILDENVQVIDVRTPEEFRKGRINGAQNICVTSNDFKEKVSQLDKNKPVYLYCKSGGRSADAAKILKEMGFTEIYDMQGGIIRWEEYGFDSDES